MWSSVYSIFNLFLLKMRCSINDNNCTKIAMTPATSNSRPSRPTIVLLTELMGNGSVCGGQLFWPVNLFQFATQPLTLFVCLSRSPFLPPSPEPICAINYRAASKNARFFCVGSWSAAFAAALLAQKSNLFCSLYLLSLERMSSSSHCFV